MKSHYLLAIALSTFATVAACGDNTDTLTDGPGADGNSSEVAGSGKNKGSSTGAAADGTTAGDPSSPSGPVPTNSPDGKAFFKANVFPFLTATCGPCHNAAGPGPNWLTSADSEKTYLQLFTQGYVIQQSRITVKGAHGGSTTNVLTTQQSTAYNQWVTMELKDGGTKAPPNILEKLGTCFDQTKFDAMQMGQWRTTPRTNQNNTNNVPNWTENTNTCTGCRNVTCNVCHSADPATNFNNAEGNNLLPPGTTFANTKLTSPAYITKFFSASPDGKPMASNGIMNKQVSTTKTPRDSHPLFVLTAAQQAGIDAFVNDAITKFNAGTCGK